MSSPQKKNPLSNVDPTSDGDPLSAVIISQSLMTGQTSSPGKGVSKHSSQKAELEVDQESLDGLTSTSDDEEAHSLSSFPELRLTRPALNQNQLQERFQWDPPPSKKFLQKRLAWAKRCKNFGACSDWLKIQESLFGLFPILKWLPNYKWKEDFLDDFVAGFTVAVMNIPQGMAYAILASSPPITGIYTAVFPLIIYIMMGTSKHASLGTFAVISLMVSKAISENSPLIDASTQNTNASLLSSSGNPLALTLSTSESVMSSSSFSQESNEVYTPQEVVATLGFLVGIFQVLFGLLRMGALVPILSDPMIRGFTTGAAFHVFTSQIKYVFGIDMPIITGSFRMIRFYASFFPLIPSTNPVTLLIASSFILLLLTYDIVLKARLTVFLKGVSFPIQLVCVAIGTIISYFLKLEEHPTNVKVVGEVPTGLPYPTLPRMSLVPNLISNAFILATVGCVISYSIAKLFATKHSYKIQPSQEFLAQGSSNLFGCFFSALPISTSLSRSAVQESSGCKTIMTTVVSVFLLLWVLLFMGPLFEPLPNAVLSAIILVSLRSMFLQFLDLPKLASKSILDTFVWIATFLATIILDVDYGLIVGVLINVFIILYWGISPNLNTIHETDFTDLHLDGKMYHDIHDTKSVLILQLKGNLNFSNSLATVEQIESKAESIMLESQSLKFVLLDLSGVSKMDSSACDNFGNLSKDLQLKKSLILTTAGVSGSLWQQFDLCCLFDQIPESRHYPSIQDAIAILDRKMKKAK